MLSLQNPSTGHPNDAVLRNNGELDPPRFSDDCDSTCSTPFVSAPSSPGRSSTPVTNGYFYSAPASPMHFVLSSAPSTRRPPAEPAFFSCQRDATTTSSVEFEFSSRFSCTDPVPLVSMTSADELFLNGQIRPMKLSSHLERPQILAALIDLDGEDAIQVDNDDELVVRGRDLKLRSRSLHRKARSLSPLRNPEFQWRKEKIGSTLDFESGKQNDTVSTETTPSCSTSSSRSSSSGRNSKKWIFLKDLLHRSKSEGRAKEKEKFWPSLPFSPSKERKQEEDKSSVETPKQKSKEKEKEKEKRKRITEQSKKAARGKPVNGVAKRQSPLSPHELHYTTNRAQAEELKKRTYLPYRHGLFGCLGFNSKGYGALNGLARSLNPVSSM